MLQPSLCQTYFLKLYCIEVSGSFTYTKPRPCHINDVGTPSSQVIVDRKEVNNPEFSNWKNNNGLLMTWLKGMMTEDILSLIIGVQNARDVYSP